MSINSNTVEPKWMNIDGFGEISYREIGNGKQKICFVHGLLLNGNLWNDLIPFLASKYTLVFPNLPLGAHKRPMLDSTKITPPGVAQLLAKFLKQMKEKDDLKRNFTVCATDTGGAITQIMLTEEKDLPIESLILTSHDCFDNFLPPLFKPLPWIASVPFFSAIMPTLGRLYRIPSIRNLPIGTGWVAKKGFPQDRMEEATESLINTPGIGKDVTNFLSTISNKYTLKAAEKLADVVDYPVSIIWSKEDPLFLAKYAEQIKKQVEKKSPLVELHYVEDCYCFLMLDQPKILAEKIDDWMQKITKI